MIPIEIYSLIFTYFDSPEELELSRDESSLILSNLSRVCRVFASICLPQIYRSLVFTGGSQLKRKTPLHMLHTTLCTQLHIQNHPTVSAAIEAANSQLLRKLVVTKAEKQTYKELASAVEECVIEGYTNGHHGTETLPDDHELHWHAAFVDKYLDAMMLMPKLRSLTLRNMWVTKIVLEKLSRLAASNSILGIILDRCHYPSEVFDGGAFRSLPIRGYIGQYEIARRILQEGQASISATLHYVHLQFDCNDSLTLDTFLASFEPFSFITSLSLSGRPRIDCAAGKLPKTILPSLRKLECDPPALQWFTHQLPYITTLNIDEGPISETPFLPFDLSKLLVLATRVVDFTFNPSQRTLKTSALFPNLGIVTIRQYAWPETSNLLSLLSELDCVSSPRLKQVDIQVVDLMQNEVHPLNLDNEYTILNSNIKERFPSLERATFNPFVKWIRFPGEGWKPKFPQNKMGKDALLKRLTNDENGSEVWVDWDGYLERFIKECRKTDNKVGAL